MNWTVIGVNYQKANLSQRQKYALNEDRIIETFHLLKKSGIQQALIISTCNRTEFFIPIDQKQTAIDLITTHIYQNDVEPELFHCKKNDEATRYFFRICSGLESQIAGDYEILGQVKKACALAKQNGMISGTWERIINNALSAAKKARTETGFYSGASSTSYACIEYLRNADIDMENLKYIILGAGKIGSHTIDHLLKLVPAENITLTNRSIDKATALGGRKNINILPFHQMHQNIAQFDVIICATNAPHFIITAEHIIEHKNQYIIDLSVPLNVDPSLKSRPNIQLLNVDELSEIINQNLKKREAEKAVVEQIIEDRIEDLKAWFTIKSGMPMLAELKEELADMKREALMNVDSGERAHSEKFLNEYTDELFNQLSQQWIKKVRNRAVNAD
ncbi:glutamyl-tRNA reductase [Portibacter marinus]|uniref:glutamyl-tRNA reductase n=1 Tax=Portibacter marinus TaxID=2898660 RepID=UPI001F01FB00|nr:glutamyl-tRNA reductase [Portibacter marinus]